MSTRSVIAGLGTLLFLIGVGVGPPTVGAQAPAQPAPSRAQGLWRSGDTTLRITMQGTEARAVFAEVGQQAKALGFKPGEASFVASVTGPWFSGVQTIRYSGGRCFQTGRKVPMMGGITPNGQMLVVHFYNVPIDANCRDSGPYSVIASAWQRVPGQ